MDTCAKVNLFLKITGKRPDGYHELENIFWPLPWLKDTVTVTLKASGGISMECETPVWCALNPFHVSKAFLRDFGANATAHSDYVRKNLHQKGQKGQEHVTDLRHTTLGGVPVDETNLCWKAAKAFLETTALPLSPHIALTKRIPVAAGLGGGSSDAAATLLELNSLAGNPLKENELHAIATKLGADVPFFLNPVPSIATGIGEALSPVPVQGSCHVFLANPQFPVPASWAYKHWHEDFVDTGTTCAEMLSCMKAGKWEMAFSIIRNDLEYCIFKKFQILGIVREKMEAMGISNVHISGSGPTLFGLSTPEISSKAKPLLEAEFDGFLKCYCECI